MPRKPKGEGTPLGDRVRSARIAKGLTQSELARQARVPQSNVSQIESGARTANFETDTLLALERVLELWPGELLAILSGGSAVASRERFILSHGHILTAEDKDDLRRIVWFGPDEDPPDEAWLGLVYSRRMVRQKKNSQPSGDGDKGG